MVVLERLKSKCNISCIRVIKSKTIIKRNNKIILSECLKVYNLTGNIIIIGGIVKKIKKNQKKILTFISEYTIITFVAVSDTIVAQIAQSVEQRTENPRVGGSIPSLGTHTCGCGTMVEHQPSKLRTWVRFPSPAWLQSKQLICASGSVVEHRLAKARAAGSNPVSRS